MTLSGEPAPEVESSTHILVVEDDADIRHIMVLALRDEGYEVEEAASGQSALDLLECGGTHPEIILLDMKMPGMDGEQFARRYRELYGRHAQIILVTAANEASVHRPKIDADSHISKPFDIGELLDKVSALARRPQV
jgi:CheY-like chemotaxis protein